MNMTRRELARLIGLLTAGELVAQLPFALAKESAPPTPSPSDKAEPAKSPPPASVSDKIWADLMEGNRRFVAGTETPRNVAAVRKVLANGQHPQVIVLTCADSRVSPELIFDKNLGELFVVRSAGNIADRVGLGSIEYAAEHLKARLLLVMGHDKCGAVAAALAGAKVHSPNLASIVRRITPAVKKVKDQATGEDLLRLAVEANARQSAEDVLKKSRVLAEIVEHGDLTVVRAVYRLTSGEVVRLP